jgi:maleylacetoacetate isomerase
VILYDYFRSSAAFRVRIALGLKGLPAERRFIHLKKGEQRAPAYLALNPQGLLPMLIDAPTALTQSLAIIEYLEETHPSPPLLPKSPGERAWVRSLAMAVACDIHPLNNTRVLGYLERELRLDQQARDAWYRHWIGEGFAAIETMLAGRPGRGPFCLGATPTIADCCIVPQVFNARRFDCPLDRMPTIMSVFDACMKLPAFDLAQPLKQQDAE